MATSLETATATLHALRQTLSVLRSKAMDELPESGPLPSTGTAGQGLDRLPDSTPHTDLVADVVTVIDGVVETLAVHTPRSAGFWGAPVRCAHDNRQWPCKSVAALLDTLADVIEKYAVPTGDAA